MDTKEIGWEVNNGVIWLIIGIKWQALVKTATNFRVLGFIK
jgi:hypothetical protein